MSNHTEIQTCPDTGIDYGTITSPPAGRMTSAGFIVNSMPRFVAHTMDGVKVGEFTQEWAATDALIDAFLAAWK